MLVEDTEIDGAKIVTTRKFVDERGFFSEVHNQST
jgi:dTDP-4-dehydrorhamnose 3,5-epimerase-like enzyme